MQPIVKYQIRFIRHGDDGTDIPLPSSPSLTVPAGTTFTSGSSASPNSSSLLPPDPGLTARGRRECEIEGTKQFQELKRTPLAIYCSPYRRCIETAECLLSGRRKSTKGVAKVRVEEAKIPVFSDSGWARCIPKAEKANMQAFLETLAKRATQTRTKEVLSALERFEGIQIAENYTQFVDRVRAQVETFCAHLEDNFAKQLGEKDDQSEPEFWVVTHTSVFQALQDILTPDGHNGDWISSLSQLLLQIHR